MKQISNYKFYDMKDGTKKRDIDGRYIDLKDGHIKVVAPDGEESILSQKDADILYKRLYAAKTVDKLIDETLSEVGLTVDNAHLSDYKTLKKFESIFEYKLRKNSVDLSFISGVRTKKYGIEISGNALGITSSCTSWLWCRPWEKVCFTEDELKEYLNKHRRIGVYEKDEYFSVKKSDRKILKGIKFGTSSSNIGIGSAASVLEHSIVLKKDKQGNLFVDRYTLVYD